MFDKIKTSKNRGLLTKWWPVRDLNPCMHAWKACVLNRFTNGPLLMVGLGGLEPPTSRLSGVRSNQLSYKPTNKTFFILHYFLIICNSFCKIYDFFCWRINIILYKPNLVNRFLTKSNNNLTLLLFEFIYHWKIYNL